MYGFTGFIEGARISSISARSCGLNYPKCDAIAACVIGGVSFVGSFPGKISGIVL